MDGQYMEDLYRIEVVRKSGGKNFRMSDLAAAILDGDYPDQKTALFAINALKHGSYKKWQFRIVKQLGLF